MILRALTYSERTAFERSPTPLQLTTIKLIKSLLTPSLFIALSP
jgi:hypothetical protein